MDLLVKVAILDAHDLSRHGLTVILAHAPDDVRVTKVLSQKSDLEAFLRPDVCDVLLLDDAVETVRDVSEVLHYLRQTAPEMRVIVLSQMLHQGYIQQLIQEGASGFLYKGDRFEEILLPAIRSVMRGELCLSPRVSALPYQSQSLSMEDLGVRECRVLQLLKTGLTVREIAEALHLDVKSVYRSREKLRESLGVRTNEQIVPTAHTLGLLRDVS